ncbi:fimbrial biogenesis chaperone [Pinirhizobacter sp.]|jgi:chaperone protein EcpD|uniref:fimbrial biogenesis chaperone n=1 Tax=Pinirhizobacter sp. TaxID=2950432 RepID=UPI002F3EA062
MTTKMRSMLAGLLLATGVLAGTSHAGVVINGTRVVYPAQDKEVTVKLTNDGTKPALVQVWLDDGDEKSTPDTAKVPFNITPPLFRMEPGKGQAVRVMYSKEALPTDRESLFWVNVLEVPPKAADGADRNLLQFAFRTRIKLFFRPPGLAADVSQAPTQLRWSARLAANSKGVEVVVDNPTPYHVSFSTVGIKSGEREFAAKTGGMVAPGAKASFVIEGLTAIPASGAQASFSTISDYGAVKQLTAPLSP